MKRIHAFFMLSLLLLYVGQINGRKGPEEYWKDVMKDEAMPEAIKRLLKHDEKVDAAGSSSEKKTRDHFKRNFDTRPTAIIYHRVDHKVEGKSSILKNEKKGGN